MKRNFIFICFAMTCALSFSQVKINADGKVGIATSAVPLSTLSINTAGESIKEAKISSTKSITFSASRDASTSSGWARAVDAGVGLSPHAYNVGVIGFAYTPTAIDTGQSFGLIGIAGNYTPGSNYGVLAMLYGTNKGAGIYATSVHNDYGTYINGRYAGYFRGNVFVTGSVNGMLLTPVISSSNPSLLSSQSDSEESAMTKLSRLNTIQFSMQSPLSTSRAALSATDTVAATKELTFDEAQIYSRAHYGLIAQELKEVYPNLVYENEQGGLSINYIEMIPLLVQSIQELTTEVNQLKSGEILPRNAAANEGNEVVDSNPMRMSIPKLYQNTPNPFNQSTEIAYQLSQDARSASISIFNLNGGLLKRYPLSPGTTTGKVQVSATDFEPGMYVYALIIDGTVIDSKRMVLE